MQALEGSTSPGVTAKAGSSPARCQGLALDTPSLPGEQRAEARGLEAKTLL